MVSTELQRKPDETELQYLYRIGKLKDDQILDMTWGEIATIMNKQLRDPDEEWTESAYRKKYKLLKDAYEQVFSGYQDDSYLTELTLQKQEIQKERRKLYDERLDLNKRLREEARLETTIDKLSDSLNTIVDTYFPPGDIPVPHTYGNKLIVCLSDLHIGQEFSNNDGEFNTDIAANRMKQYLGEVLSIGRRNDCDECIVCLLGDMISGNIHHRISVTNKENVVEQVKIASMLVAEFVSQLSLSFSSVDVYSVGGNHSRLEKVAEDALLNERLDDLIPWFLNVAMKHRDNVTVYANTFDETLGIFEVGDKTYFIQHGDYTNVTDAAIGKLVLWAKRTPYCILTGHWHTPSMTDVSGVTVIQSGSLCGSGDDYTRSKRLTGKPSQTVLVAKNDGSIYGVYPVTLK